MRTATKTDYPIHLRLVTTDIIDMARKKLTRAEILIFQYIETLNPFCDRTVEIRPAVVIEQLDISRATYYRAIARLQELGMIEYTPGVDRVKGKPMTLYRERDSSLKNETIIAPLRSDLHARDKQRLEALLDKDFGTVHTHKDFNKQTTPTHHPVVVDEIFPLQIDPDLNTPPETFQGNFTDPDLSKISQPNQTQKAQTHNQTHSSQTKETDEDRSSAAADETEIFQEIKELIEPGKINPQIRALVLEAIAKVGVQVVKDAIAAVKEYKTHQKAKGKELANPVGTFRQALNEQWQPVQRKVPEKFSEWYNLAYKLNLVVAASDKPDLTGQPSGVQCVFTTAGEWVLWETYKKQYPLEKLREAATNFSRRF
ncbi:hypothetical protein [Pseudanabaena sp. PCC 6802]|uniref:hypothetical protein n=1 Tax=Pseudanabaena sp. PCC 6802 TaxID=118173 RepID=UPI00034904B4|nr:hypothetical protein [Pseudanabaena sp. PCC 6802]